MKTKWAIVFAGLAALIVTCALLMVPNRRSHWEQLAAALQNVPRDRLEAAVQAFTRDRKAATNAMPATVPLRDLVARGYLGTNDIRGLEGRDATVSLFMDETTPQMILIRVHERNGSDTALMMDGSVQGLPRGWPPTNGSSQ